MLGVDTSWNRMYMERLWSEWYDVCLQCSTNIGDVTFLLSTLPNTTSHLGLLSQTFTGWSHKWTTSIALIFIVNIYYPFMIFLAKTRLPNNFMHSLYIHLKCTSVIVSPHSKWYHLLIFQVLSLSLITLYLINHIPLPSMVVLTSKLNLKFFKLSIIFYSNRTCMANYRVF